MSIDYHRRMLELFMLLINIFDVSIDFCARHRSVVPHLQVLHHFA